MERVCWRASESLVSENKRLAVYARVVSGQWTNASLKTDFGEAVFVFALANTEVLLATAFATLAGIIFSGGWFVFFHSIQQLTLLCCYLLHPAAAAVRQRDPKHH